MTREKLKSEIKRSYLLTKGGGWYRLMHAADAKALGMDDDEACGFILGAVGEADDERRNAGKVPEKDKEPWMRLAARLSACGGLSPSRMDEIVGRMSDELGVWRQDAEEIIGEGIRRYEMSYRMEDAEFGKKAETEKKRVEAACAAGRLGRGERLLLERRVAKFLGTGMRKAGEYVSLVIREMKSNGRTEQ